MHTIFGTIVRKASLIYLSLHLNTDAVHCLAKLNNESRLYFIMCITNIDFIKHNTCESSVYYMYVTFSKFLCGGANNVKSNTNNKHTSHKQTKNIHILDRIVNALFNISYQTYGASVNLHPLTELSNKLCCWISNRFISHPKQKFGNENGISN